MEGLGVDISALSIGEMRRLIAQAKARGQTGLAKHLQSELAWRRDELRGREAPAWGVHAAGPAAAETDFDADADADGSAEADPATLPRAAAWRGPGRAWQLAAAAVGGAAVAGVAAWAITSAGLGPRSAPPPAPSSAPRAAAPAPAAVAEAPSPPAATLVPAPLAEATAASAPERASPASHSPAACRTRPTPGLRAVCASRSLRAQDQRMRRAYDRALAAGADRARLDRGQAQWRALRDRTSSPARLARLYRARIAALNAAAQPTRAKGAGRHAQGAAHRGARHRWWRWW